MPISPDLLEILCCPLTKVPVRLLRASLVLEMNDAISKANVRYLDGSIVEDPMEEALITADNLRIYPVRDSIPVMLVEQSILTDQLGSAWLARLSSSDMEAP